MRAPWRGAILPETAYRLTLPGDKIEVRETRSLDNDQLASIFQKILKLVYTLAADIDFMAQGRIRDPGHTATLIGVDGEGQEQGTGGTFGLRFLPDVLYNRHRHRREPLSRKD